MKCEICSSKLQETFLRKVIGTIVKDEKGKKHTICSNCQRSLKSKKDVFAKL